MKTQAISAAVDTAIKNVKPRTAKTAKNMSEKLGIYAVAGVGTYVGAKLLSDLRGDSVEIGHQKQVGWEPDTLGAEIGRPTGYIPKMEWTNEPTLLQKLQAKVKDAFDYDINNPPKWVDPTQPYLMDSKGNFLTDDWGIIVNPWYNKELADAANAQIIKPTMDSFLNGTTAKTIDSTGAISDLKGFLPMKDIDGHPILSYDGFPVPDFQGTGLVEGSLEEHTPDMVDRVINALQNLFDFAS